jgi:sulfide:quinone oxidoreductase
VDASGRVDALEDVYAAGDLTTCPIKQGGLAAQQADAVAQTIAASLGIPVKQIRAPQVLNTRMVAGEMAVFLRTELDWRGQPTRATQVRLNDEHTAKAAKVLGRYLLPYLETLEPLSDDRQAAA